MGLGSFPTTRPTRRNASDSAIPIYGRSAPCQPRGLTYIEAQGMVRWSWYEGQFSWLKILIWVSPVSALIGLVAVVVGIVTAAWYVVVLGAIQTLFFCVLMGIVPNWMWNEKKQYAISVARLKSKEAARMWERVEPHFHFYAKDVFFETSYGAKSLKVLRDGTIEVHGCHNDAGDGSDLDMFGDMADMAAEITDTSAPTELPSAF
ncbi:expressed unknown protein [Seminavis robusta]|uniref:Uncharacterized protein n=1 Tax=Seminavis robusta TaxID=568900 RepID=A0A9N8E7E3_9STRA|nr:expressed unknown protein [Seminavis robusta]|eukprot:Sro624_g177240.1 n/a (205) ;mRNA; r:3166-3780